MPDRLHLESIDPELLPGARNAVRDCLRLQPDERITIITDLASAEIAAALQQEVDGVGSECSVFVLERHALRPLKGMPANILADLARSQVSIFCAQTQTGELTSRIEMTAVVNQHRIRHGHMVNINRQIMREGMRADFLAVDAFSQRLVERVRRAERVTCRTANGTDFEADLSPYLRWVKPAASSRRRNGATCPAGRFSPRPSTPTACSWWTAWWATTCARSTGISRRRR